MPRDLYLRVNIPVPNHKGYRFSHSTGTLLKTADWKVVKETRKFSYLKPPYELLPSKTADIKTRAPTDEEVLAIAQDFHTLGIPARKMVHAFPAYYRPASATSYSSYKVDPATGEKTPSTDQSLKIPATFRVGLWEIWEAEVFWDADGTPILVKHPHQEIPPPDPTLFDHLDAPASSTPSDTPELTPELRQACLDRYAGACAVCSFSFAATYAGLSQPVIPIHRITPPADTQPSDTPDPLDLLRPICFNCQAVLASASPPLSIQDFKAQITQTGTP